MTAHPCMWCRMPLARCLVQHANTNRPCCDRCRRTEPTAHTSPPADKDHP